jgi:repressor LexA
MALTRRQKEVLDFVADFILDHGYSPSYEEMAHGLALSSLASVHKHVEALQGRKYVHRGFNQSRSLEVDSAYLESRRAERASGGPAGSGGVPLLGRIAAGVPVETYPSAEQLRFADFAGSPNTYALEVQGESMIEDHICPGDYVLIEKTSEPKDGDIVVALVDGAETTLKRFYREPDGRVRLQPANAAMGPIYVDPARIEVQGRLLAVLRKYR